MPRDFGRGRAGGPRRGGGGGEGGGGEGQTGAAALARQSWPPRGHRPRACAETFRTGTGRSRVLLGHAVRREPHQSASGSRRADEDEAGRREVGSWRSTEEAGEQSCGCNPCGGGVGGGKAASQGKCQRSAHAPDTEPTL